MTMLVRFTTALGILTTVMLAGCASKPVGGVPEVPECRQAVNATVITEYDQVNDGMQRQVDAYMTCMQSHGYELDQDKLYKELLREEQVQNADPLGGDPYLYLAKRRLELRMSARMYRPAAPPQS